MSRSVKYLFAGIFLAVLMSACSGNLHEQLEKKVPAAAGDGEVVYTVTNLQWWYGDPGATIYVYMYEEGKTELGSYIGRTVADMNQGDSCLTFASGLKFKAIRVNRTDPNIAEPTDTDGWNNSDLLIFADGETSVALAGDGAAS